MAAKLSILLSTYSGARFLREQLDSLVAQSYPHLVIRVRDDGSKDNTGDILREYAEAYPQLKFELGENLGVVRSFMKLLEKAEADCEYFAFCDQDDVWLKDKVLAAVEKLEELDHSKPLLYCSRQEYVDENLNSLGYSPLPHKIGLGNALVENIATGCTVVINRQARQRILQYLPEKMIMHDWWAYLVAAAFGQVVYDSNATIKYRQHGGNAVGATANPFMHFIKRAKRFVNSNKNVFRPSNQAENFLRCFGAELSAEDRELIERFLAAKSSFLTRVKYALTTPVWRQSKIDNLILRGLIVVGRY